jgi:PAS domain S-box-containing protein
MSGALTPAEFAPDSAENILESITDGFVALDHEWRYTYINATAEREHGMPRARVIGRRLLEVFPDLEGGYFHQMCLKAVAGRGTVEFELYYEPHRRWNSVRLFPTPHGLSIYFRDVSEQRAAGEERQRLHDLVARKAAELEAVIQSIPDPVYVGNADGITQCNRPALAMAGVPSVEFLSLPIGMLGEWAHVRTAADRRPVAADRLPFARALRGEVVGGEELIVTHLRNSHDIYIRTTAAPIELDGRIIGAVGTNTDITEFKRVEAALRHSEASLRMAADLVGLCWYEWVPATGEVDWDPRVNAMWGLPPDAHVDYDVWLAGIHPDDRAAVESALASALDPAGSGAYAAEYRVVGRLDGIERWISARGQTVLTEGRPTRFFGTLMEVTEIKRAEERLRASREQEHAARLEAEHAARIKDDFLAVVSHELRTPLTAILLWSQMLETGRVPPAQQPAACRTIRESAEAQRQLIEDLLDVSRMLSGDLRLDVRDAELEPVVRAAVDALRPAAQANGVEVRAAFDGGVGSVAADPDRVRQVVANLLDNAVKFTPRGGRITVNLGRLGDRVRIAVTDTGRGIPAEFLPHVFDRFRQADTSVTRLHGGLGLGLAISRKLVELHGGTITAYSAGEGKGASFVVELPLAGQPATPEGGGPAPEFIPSPVLKGVRALLVDDEPSTRQVIQWVLERCEAEVTAVDSVTAALDAFRAGVRGRAFDVVVSDIAMPKQDGYELMRRVRALERETTGGAVPPVPAVALTAFARDEDRRRALEAGFQHHVPKPIAAAALVEAVARSVGRSGPPDPPDRES